MQAVWVLVTSGDPESAQREPAQLGGTAPPTGVESLPLDNVLLCVTLAIPLGRKRGPGQDGHERPGMGLCWAAWLTRPGQGPASQGGGY